ncbi:unnamed protein product [Notodromas monacha]|uniref:Mitotic spindle assembly checkpoint protein MAD1 n=1 Tax=Notodromas monacha TaxID=399045 RepID=A0A7R9BVI7_9CRUS|nr:unnamed protein product [Notodromas monacha]CAG0921385.1 unnamed protein product [Notodromas monacha]
MAGNRDPSELVDMSISMLDASVHLGRTDESVWSTEGNTVNILNQAGMRRKLMDSESKLFRAETEILKLRQDLGKRDSVIRSLQDRSRDVTSVHATQIRGEKRKADLKQEVRQANSEKEIRKRELEHLNSEILELKQSCNEKIASSLSSQTELQKELDVLKDELRRTRLKLNESQQTVKEFDDMKKLEKVFYTRLTDVPSIMLENEKLKKNDELFRRGSAKALVLEAQNHDLKEENAMLREQLDDFNDLRSEKAILDVKLSSWESVGAQLIPSSLEINPHNLAATIAGLQENDVRLATENGKLRSDSNAAEVKISEHRSKIVALSKTLREQEEKANDLQRRLNSALRLKQLVILERDSCRRLLDSYQNDITAAFSPADQRLSEMENILAEYRQEIERLTAPSSPVHTTLPEVATDSEASSLMEKKDTDHSETIKKLKDANESLTREVTSLRAALESVHGGTNALEAKVREAEKSCYRLESELALARKFPPSKDNHSRIVLESELDSLKHEIAALRKEKTDVLSDQCRILERFNVLLRKKEVCEEEKSKIELIVADVKSALVEAEAKKSQAQVDLDASLTEFETLKSCVEDMEVVQRESETQITELTSKLIARESELNSKQLLDEELSTCKQRLEELTVENGSLLKQIEELKKSSETIKSQIKDQPESSEGGIIVRLRNGPIAWQRKERENEFEMLKAEVKALRTKLAVASSSKGETPSLDTTSVGKEDEYSYKEIRDLKLALKRSETMSERLRKEWKATSQEFRELVYQFSGYKLDKIGPDNFKLTSMYADSPEDFFLLRRTSDGLIEMLDSDFCGANKTSFECYLTKRRSIPAFLAAVTLDLNSRETE